MSRCGLTRSGGNLDDIQGFSPRGSVSCTSAGIDVTDYLAVEFTEDVTATLTFVGGGTALIEKAAGDIYIVDPLYLSEIATATTTTLLWM